MAAQVEAGKVLLDAEALNRTLARIAHEIVEGNRDLERTALVGCSRTTSSRSFSKRFSAWAAQSSSARRAATN